VARPLEEPAGHGRHPDALRSDATPAPESDAEIADPGVHQTGLSTPSGDSFYVVAMHLYDPQRGHDRELQRRDLAHADRKFDVRPPGAGVIEVTQDNESTPVSQHFSCATS
jgi:hypothetical protein